MIINTLQQLSQLINTRISIRKYLYLQIKHEIYINGDLINK